MLFNLTKNYKSFTAVKSLWFAMSLLGALIPAIATASDVQRNELIEISHNTIQNDRLELVFSFSNDISTLPEVKSSMSPAMVEVLFEAGDFAERLKILSLTMLVLKVLT